jgi:hypothetical protein
MEEESKWVAVAQALAASILIAAFAVVVPLFGLMLIPVLALGTAARAITAPLKRSTPRLLRD